MKYLTGENSLDIAIVNAMMPKYREKLHNAQDSPARFIEVFVDSLDLEAMGFEHTVPAHTGRPPYNPYRMLTRIHPTITLESGNGMKSAS